MKSTVTYLKIHGQFVTLYARVWIEMHLMPYLAHNQYVTLYARVWIRVTLYARVWIEIFQCFQSNRYGTSHPLREGVD